MTLKLSPWFRACRPVGAGVLAVALCACAAQPEFVPPPQPRAAKLEDQLKLAESLAKRAQEAERNKRPEEAIALYKQAIVAYRDFPGVWYNLGLLLLNEGETLAAVEAFRTAGEIEPRDPRPPYSIGVIYENQGWHQEAQRHYSDALARDPNYHEALRRSVYLDMIENSHSALTLERTRRALAAEKDEKWRDFFERTQLRLNTLLTQPPAATGAIMAPETDSGPSR